MHDDVIVSVSDLRFVTLACRHCNTRVTLDLEAEFEPPRAPFRSPRECPRCGNPFDSAVPGAAELMQRVYKAVAGLGGDVTFTVKQKT
jgi:hypothetical protein